MRRLVYLRWPGGALRGTFRLPASKSESNRALILRAVAGGGTIAQLSGAHDTQLLAHLLTLPPQTPVLDCEDAGTTLRFLTAYAAVTNRRCVICGTARMHERPIGPLVDALRALGADITYLGQPGFPPLRLNGFAYSGQSTLAVAADVSSQFVSALLLVAPVLPQGLRIELVGRVSSAPYLHLTAHALSAWGARVAVEPQTVRVWPGGLRPTAYTVEADWSAASYGYALAALAPAGSELHLPNLRGNSAQGDRQIATWAADLGVQTVYTATGGQLLTQPQPSGTVRRHYDFTHQPDLAQTLAVMLAARGQRAVFSGLHSLRVKETDRVAALQAELPAIGAALVAYPNGRYALRPQPVVLPGPAIRTYHDHRMALAFAAVALLRPVSLEDPEVVRKSFPDFWQVLGDLGFDVTFTAP